APATCRSRAASPPARSCWTAGPASASTPATPGASPKTPDSSVGAGTVRDVHVAVAAAAVLPRDVAHALRFTPCDGEAPARLLARARAGVVDPLRRPERLPAVAAAREEDVVVSESIVLPGEEQRAGVDCDRRRPLVRRWIVIGIGARLRVVDLDVR